MLLCETEAHSTTTQDYEEIFELTVDVSHDQKNVFDVCKNDLLFKYYPIDELIKSGAPWQVLKFK